MNGYIEQIRKKNPKFKFIPIDKIYINRYTPIGDTAEFYERKAYGGKREFYPIGEVKDNKYNSFQKTFDYEKKEWKINLSSELKEFLNINNIEYD